MYYIKETYLVNGLTFFTLELNQKKKAFVNLIDDLSQNNTQGKYFLLKNSYVYPKPIFYS